MIFANINIGSSPDDHTGDPLRVAFDKINRNFANITTNGGSGVTAVAGRSGNVILSVNDVVGAVSIGSLPQLVSEALSDISVPTTTDLTDAIAQVLLDANAYTDSAVGNLLLNAPAGLQTIKQIADAIGGDPAFYMQVVNVRNGLNTSNVAIANNTSNIAGLWANAAIQSINISSLNSTFVGINANVTAANSAIATNAQGISALQTTTGNQASQIAMVNANVTAANSAITSLQNAGYATTGYVDTRISGVVGAAPAALDTLKELADALNDDANFASHIVATTTATNANVSAANLAISALQSDTASLAGTVATHTTNINQLTNGQTAANVNISVLQGNTASLAASIATVQYHVDQTNANVTAANSSIGALQTLTASHTNAINATNANVTAANSAITTHTNQINTINANVSAANLAIGVINGTVTSLNTTVTNHQNALTTGPISISGNISGNNITANGRVIINGGIFWANGTAFVSGGGAGGAVNTGNIIFDGDTITTVDNQDAGITFNAAGNGEIHIKNNTGINNANPGYWLEVGNLTDSINTGSIAVDFSNGSGYYGSAVWSWDWHDGIAQGSGSGPKHARTGLYKNGDLNQGLITFDIDTPANAIVVSSNMIRFGSDITVAGNISSSGIIRSTGSAVIGDNAGNPNLITNIPLYVSNNPNIPTTPYTVGSAIAEIVTRFVGNDNGNAFVIVDSYSSNKNQGPAYESRSARGNILAPEAVQANDLIGRFGARAYGTTRFSPFSVASMQMQADGTCTDTSYPTAISFYTTSEGNARPAQAARIGSTGNLVLLSRTASTSTQTGAMVIQGGGGLGVTGAIHANIVNANVINAVNSITSVTGLFSNVTVSHYIDSTSPDTGALVVSHGGAGISGNIHVGGILDVVGDGFVNGRLTVESSNDVGDGYENEALHVDGGARVYGSMIVGHQLFLGNDSVTSTTQNAVMSAQLSPEFAGGAAYTQIALKNVNQTGSADYAAYADNGTDAAGWVDMGFTSSQFADGIYTITKPNDGYVFVRPVNGFGGNLVLATSEAGTYNDLVFAVGSFDSSAEVARFHGNVATGGSFTIKTDLVVQGNLISQHPGSATITSGNDITLSPVGNIVNLGPMVLVKLTQTQLTTTIANTTGAVAYNTTANAPVYFNGTNWVFFSNNTAI